MNKACQKCNQMNPPTAVFCLSCASPFSVGNFSGGQQANQYWNQPNFSGYQGSPNLNQSYGNTREASSRAKWARALGFLGIACFGPLASIPAIILGWMELDAINKGQSPPSGRSMAMSGLVSGILGTLVQLGAVLFAIIAFLSME